MTDQETTQEMLDRVQQMAIDNGMTWDLSENDQFALQCCRDIASAFCPVHAQSVANHREDSPHCVLCDAHRMREWLEGIRDFATRTMPHAVGQGHAALMSVASAASRALNGEAETYAYRNRTATYPHSAQDLPPAEDTQDALSRLPSALCAAADGMHYYEPPLATCACGMLNALSAPDERGQTIAELPGTSTPDQASRE